MPTYDSLPITYKVADLDDVAESATKKHFTAEEQTQLAAIAPNATYGFGFASTSDDLDGTSEEINFQTNQHNHRTISADTTLTATGTPPSGEMTIGTLMVENTSGSTQEITFSTGFAVEPSVVQIPDQDYALFAFWKHSSGSEWRAFTDTPNPYDATSHDKSSGYVMVAGDFNPYGSAPGKVNLLSGVTALTLNTGLTWNPGASCIVTNESAGSVTIGGTADRSGAVPTTLESEEACRVEMSSTVNDFYFS